MNSSQMNSSIDTLMHEYVQRFSPLSGRILSIEERAEFENIVDGLVSALEQSLFLTRLTKFRNPTKIHSREVAVTTMIDLRDDGGLGRQGGCRDSIRLTRRNTFALS